ncbi:Thioredoxin reductase [Spironucleus salmonicida]|nr:thioredoxin reductase [Spironucleus salmonicida]KAH0576858.1 Thioredoxin reductase [Spironucleus salmonicida]|eukprot:EST45259.1 Thioredoxin reductase [Spironucleus salmonicida]
MSHTSLVIVGGGPGGLAAAIYAGRAGLTPVIFLGIETSSQLMTTTEVENYPGFKTIQGPDLVQNQVDQAEHCGAQLFYEDVTKIDATARPFKITHGYENEIMTCDALIFATGSTAQRLDVIGEKQFWQKGVSACAVCDSMMAKNKDTVVVGGGDVACEEASYLSNIASKVYLILRRDAFRASAAMVQRVKSNPKIEIIYNSAVQEIKGETRVNQILVKNLKSGDITPLKVEALFWCIGHTPQTRLLKGQVKMSENGYILVENQTQYTNVPGIFAAGDCCDWIYRQAIVAAGSGCKAALDAERWLASNGGH